MNHLEKSVNLEVIIIANGVKYRDEDSFTISSTYNSNDDSEVNEFFEMVHILYL